MAPLFLFIDSFIIWCILTWQPGPVEFVLGIVISTIVALVFPHVFSLHIVRYLHPRRIFFILLYVPVFIFHCILANLEVAYFVLHPALPIRPGIVKGKVTLKSDIGRAFLANSLSLTPGTTTVDIINDDIYIHWLAVKTEEVEEVTKKLVKWPEFFLKEIFE